jgi:hypothetical protein
MIKNFYGAPALVSIGGGYVDNNGNGLNKRSSNEYMPLIPDDAVPSSFTTKRMVDFPEGTMHPFVGSLGDGLVVVEPETKKVGWANLKIKNKKIKNKK